jgi:hypothetical protein
MKLKMTVSEVTNIFKENQKQPVQLVEMIRADIREKVGQYLTAMMNKELTQFLGRCPSKRTIGQKDWFQVSYKRLYELLPF